MEKITLDLFTKFSFLSDLQRFNKNLLFVESKCDMEHNNYYQYLHTYNLENKEDKVLFHSKRTPFFALKDRVLVVKNDEDNPYVHTHFYTLDSTTGDLQDAFTLPLSVSTIVDFNDEYYLVSAGVNRHKADYHLWSDEQKEQDLQAMKANEDYVVFDEYPFFFNGAGIINGNREMLFKVHKTNFEITALTTPTMDVETFDFNDTHVVFTAVDFETFKGKWPHVYQVNFLTGEIEEIYDQTTQVARAFYYQDKIIVMATFAKEYGAMETNKFYELKNNELHLVLDCDYSFYNSVGSDCRYGKVKNYLKVDGKVYFISSYESRSVVLEYTGDAIEHVVSFEGSVDDMQVIDDEIYVIGLQDQNLQEVLSTKDGIVPLTHMNTALEGKYVAKPERVVLDKETPIVGWVLKPYNYDPNKVYPAILDIHGGPKTAYGEVYYHEMQYWASLGYFVMFCNPRGSDGRGNAFADLRQKFGTIDYEDIMDFVDEVCNRYPIDANKLGVTGGSYGGYMTNWIVTHTDRFKAAASQRSISNWITEVCASDYGIDFPIEQEYDDIYNCHDGLWEMSPLKYANNAVTPTLFIQAIEDYRCPICEPIQLYTVLKCRGVDTKLVAFKEENHDLSRTGKPLHRIKRLTEITEWIGKYIQ